MISPRRNPRRLVLDDSASSPTFALEAAGSTTPLTAASWPFAVTTISSKSLVPVDCANAGVATMNKEQSSGPRLNDAIPIYCAPMSAASCSPLGRTRWVIFPRFDGHR